jgi:hypothetical protein
MDAPLRRRPRRAERWSERLPAAYFTRIVQPVDFDPSRSGEGGPLHVVGRDRGGTACYCHYVCEFDCPRCFGSPHVRLGERPAAVVARELRAWRMNSGRWLVCIVDRLLGSPEERTRYSTLEKQPASVCLDGDRGE